jgi:hypothetical protein
MDLATPQASAAPLASAEHFLARIDVLIDWSRFERPDEDDGSAAVGADGGVPLHALKIALLKHWYGLADQAAAFQILDRLSCRAFLGFRGDGSALDGRILDELAAGTLVRDPAVADALAEIDEALRDLGYAVRCGQMQEPSLAPCTESGADVRASGPTSLFRPGELGRMVEAVTAKAHADGVVLDSGSFPRIPEPAAASRPIDDLAADRGDKAVRAVLEWPWGQRTELTEHLHVGRDFQFSPLARELTPYTHVSRKHAELLVYGDGVWVRDLGSRNGTYVNDEEVPKGQAYLIDSDSVIRFGPLLAVAMKLGP